MKMRSLARPLAVVAMAMGALASGGSGPAAADTTLKLAHASTVESLVNQAVVRFAAEVAAETKGSVKVQNFPNGQLGDEGPISEGVGSGSIDIGLGGIIEAVDPRLGVVTLPFLFKDNKAVHAFLDGPEGQKLLLLGQDRGYKLLGALDSGFRDFASNAKPIVKPEDLRGMKIRTPPIPVILETMKAFGALPQSIPFGQVYTALQSKVVDGAEPELRDYADEKWYESARYLTLSNYVWTANWWYMNKKKYDGLGAAERAGVDKAVADTTRWYRDNLDRVYAETVSMLKSKGVVVTAIDNTPFQSMADPVYQHFSQEWGAPLVDAVRKAALEAAK